jgi:C-terminal domain 9 of the ABC-three component (ABC-3C) systems
LLARAERQFNDVILPQVTKLDAVGINQLTNELIVEPAVMECGASVFQLDHNTALGMVYWLAEQCFVRWHK